MSIRHSARLLLSTPTAGWLSPTTLRSMSIAVAEQALGFGVALLPLQRLGEAGIRDRDAKVVFAVALSLNLDGLAEQALGLGLVVQLVLDERQVAPA